MKHVYAFDFDGTLTNRDSLIEFIRFARGNRAFWTGFILHSPLLLLMKAGLYANHKAKEHLFSYFFRGWTTERFNDVCHRFAVQCADIMRPKAVEYINKVAQTDCEIVIVSASIENWVTPFLKPTEVASGRKIHVLGTRIETKNGKITGRFITRNCYGSEKVTRLEQLFGSKTNYKLTAFGDSRGDKELLNYADEAHYRPFE